MSSINDSFAAYELARDTGVTTLELEKIIISYSPNAFYYAEKILKRRFELGEKTISQDAFYSLHYAIDVLKARFKLGEKVISKNSYPFFCYTNFTLRYNHE